MYRTVDEHHNLTGLIGRDRWGREMCDVSVRLGSPPTAPDCSGGCAAAALEVLPEELAGAAVLVAMVELRPVVKEAEDGGSEHDDGDDPECDGTHHEQDDQPHDDRNDRQNARGGSGKVEIEPIGQSAQYDCCACHIRRVLAFGQKCIRAGRFGRFWTGRRSPRDGPSGGFPRSSIPHECGSARGAAAKSRATASSAPTV